jgi:collagen type VII alpha
MKNPKRHPVGAWHAIIVQIEICLLAMFAWGVQCAYAGQPAATAARLTNPAGFINRGTIKLKPKASPSSMPVATAITVDTTLCAPMCTSTNSGAVTGTPIAGQSGELYTIAPTYGTTRGTNEFFSFSTFNIGYFDTANFQIPNSGITNIISRVSSNTSTTIDGTISSPVSLWFINPAGVIIGAGALLNVTGGFSRRSADYVSFANGDRWYAIDSSATVANPSVLSTSTPVSFGFLTIIGVTNIVVDTTLCAPICTPTNSGPISGTSPPPGSTYTITPAYGVTAGANEFFSFSTFNLGTNDTANFQIPNNSIANVVSRVTGIGSVTNIDGTINSPVSFWFVNPSGIIITKNAVFNVSGSLALGAADYINLTNGNTIDKFYADPAQPLTLSVGTPASFGFVSTPATGALTVQSSALGSGGGLVMLMSGGPLTVQGTTISSCAPISYSYPGVTPQTQSGNITIQSESSVALTNAQINSVTNTDQGIAEGLVTGSVSITSTASSLTMTGSSITTAGGAGGGNSGAVNISGATGITLSGSSSINTGTFNSGNSGAVNVTSAAGPVTIADLSIDTGAVGGSGLVGSASGSVSVSAGTILALTNSQVDTYASPSPGSRNGAGPSGPISLSGVNGVNLSSTVDGVNHGSATQLSAGAYGTGGQAGSITVTSTAGPVTIDSSTISTTNNLGAAPGNVTISAASFEMTDSCYPVCGASSIVANAASGGTGGNITITATGNASITNGSTVSSTSLGGGNAGNITIMAGSLEIGGATISSSATGGETQSPGGLYPAFAGNAGIINIESTAGSVVIGVAGSPAGSTTISSAANLLAGQAGKVSITSATNLSLQGGVSIDTSVATGSEPNSGPPFQPAAISLMAPSGTVTLTNSSLNAGTIGVVSAGDVTVSGATVEVSGGTINTTTTPATTLDVPPGLPPNFSYTFPVNSGNAGAISVTASTSSATPAATGLVTISNATLSSQSDGSTGNGGTIAISGSGVLIDSQSLISANYQNNGGNQGAPGSVAIFATGTTAANDPLSNNLTAPTAGVVRIVDSAVTATNSGGTGINHSVAGLGQIWIGADLPAASGTVSDNVIIAGSVVSTDVSAAGIGNNLTVEANNSVWIGSSPTGGYPILKANNLLGVDDVRTSATQSLISSQTEISAVSGGQILIQGGIGGVTIINSNVDANNAVDGNNAGPTRVQSNITVNVGLTGGAVVLSDSAITTETSGVDLAGNIQVTGATIDISTGEISASTTGAGNAGNISVTSTRADAPNGAASLQIAGATIESTASGTPATPSAAAIEAGNAGTITIQATKGSVSLGSNSAGTTPATQIKTSADALAGQAGVVKLIAARNLMLENTSVASTVAGGSAQTAPADIVLSANGPITVAGGSVDADTTGTAPGGSIHFLTPAAVTVSAATAISSNTLGAGAGGNIAIGTAADSAKNIAAAPIASLMVSGDATISVNASGAGAAAGRGGSLTVTSLGPVTLTGPSTILSSNSYNNAFGGSVAISASSLSMSGGAAVSADTSSNLITTSSPASVSTPADYVVKATLANGSTSTVTGGNVTVTTTGDVALAGAGTEISAKATGTGTGGTVTINSAWLSLADSAIIATTATNTGNSGDISITLNPASPTTGGSPPGIALTGNSQITTFSDVSTGGNINIQAAGNPLTMHNSTIKASAGGNGNGGNVTIGVAPPPGQSVLPTEGVGQTILQGSAIVAQANHGNGGRIYLYVTPGALILQDSQSLISASSNFGNTGTVIISTPQTNFNSALATPNVSITRTPEFTHNACQRDRNRSTFVREGRGGVAPGPDGYQTTVPSDVTAPALGTPSSPTASLTSTRAPTLFAAGADMGCL